MTVLTCDFFLNGPPPEIFNNSLSYHLMLLLINLNDTLTI